MRQSTETSQTRRASVGARFTALAVVALVVAACGRGQSLASPGEVRVTANSSSVRHVLASGGLQRDYYEHVPPGIDQRPAVVLVLHGGDSDAHSTETNSGFDAQANQSGFIAVYPDGFEKSWNDGRGRDPASLAGVDDVAFLAAVIADVEQRDAVNADEVYVTGISDGGFMALTFACDRADLVVAVAPNAASMGTASAASCKPSEHVSVMDIHGTADPLVPYNGGTMTGLGGQSQVLSTAEVDTLWMQLDGCSAVGAPVAQPSSVQDGTSLQIARATGCPNGVGVELWTVVGGGHTWPGGTQYLPVRVVGPVSHQFSAPTAIWSFFSAHGRS